MLNKRGTNITLPSNVTNFNNFNQIRVHVVNEIFISLVTFLPTTTRLLNTSIFNMTSRFCGHQSQSQAIHQLAVLKQTTFMTTISSRGIKIQLSIKTRI